ncbi:hypothetical protein ASZ90_017458 [hydrocarbon metagenome]|uniref:Uncharacterized protein n=1 Tax=hydrocarbon metagenome TaxID=938273 RepID=A0A0W8E9R2_9ZZZZ
MFLWIKGGDQMDRILPFSAEHKMFQETISKFVASEIVPNYELHI